MYKDFRYINAGENEIYRYGRKAQEEIASFLEPNEKGFYSVPANGGKTWTFRTSTGKYGEYAKYGDKFLPVNKGGYIWAKVGSEKAEVFIAMVQGMLSEMKRINEERIAYKFEGEDVI